MTILCEPEEAASAVLRNSIGAPVRTVESLADAAAALEASTDDDLVVVGPAVDLADVLAFVKRLRMQHPDVAVVLVRDEVTPEGEQQATDAGIRAVIPTGDPESMRQVCKTASIELPTPQLRAVDEAERDEVDDRRRVVTVFAPKGGSGKTVMSTNLACALHRRGATVCLVDLDLEFGDVAVALQLAPDRTSVDALSPVAVSDADLIAQVTTQYKPGFDCVLAPIEPGHAEKISGDLVTRILIQLRTQYDYVVVDSPSEFTEQVLAALDLSDAQVLLCNPEIPSIKNLRLTLDMLDLLGYSRQSRAIVFNRADAAAGLTPEEVEATLGAPIAVSVPASREIPASINRGVPLVASKPTHPVSRAIDEVARRYIVQEQSPEAGRGLVARLLRRSA
jgi:pilus assembly protein CpaE